VAIPLISRRVCADAADTLSVAIWFAFPPLHETSTATLSCCGDERSTRMAIRSKHDSTAHLNSIAIADYEQAQRRWMAI